MIYLLGEPGRREVFSFRLVGLVLAVAFASRKANGNDFGGLKEVEYNRCW